MMADPIKPQIQTREETSWRSFFGAPVIAGSAGVTALAESFATPGREGSSFALSGGAIGAGSARSLVLAVESFFLEVSGKTFFGFDSDRANSEVFAVERFGAFFVEVLLAGGFTSLRAVFLR
jgi:hypothetical protein